MSFQQYIFITGGVGVGKSTLISHLKQCIPKDQRCIIQEYIDFEPELGKRMLEQMLQENGNVYAFQLFILDCFERQLQHVGEKKYVIFERSPCDSIMIFSTEAYHQGRISEEQFEQLKKAVDSLVEKYHIPTFEQCSFTRVDTCQFNSNETFHHVKNIIDSQHEKKQHSCFLLYCSDPHRQKENIENRGRPEERNYDINYMININQKYEDIFSPYF